MNDPIKPFLEPAPGPATRLEAPIENLPALAPMKNPIGSSLGVAALGIFILGVGFCAVAAGDFVADQFSRDALLGYATLGILVTGTTIILIGIFREMFSLASLQAIESLRGDFASSNIDLRARAVKNLISKLPPGESQILRESFRGINDPDAMIAILRAGPIADRIARGDAAARAAALQLAAGLAAMPSPALAAIFTFWRGLRLIREIADIHGLRPGFLGSLALVQRTAMSAGSVAGIEMATNVAAHALLSNPLLQQVTGDMAGAGLAARRMLVLGRAAADACSPLVR